MIDQNMKQKELKYVKLMEDLKEKILSGEIHHKYSSITKSLCG